jgi:beta-glucanase (GH16 family)
MKMRYIALIMAVLEVLSGCGEKKTNEEVAVEQSNSSENVLVVEAESFINSSHPFRKEEGKVHFDQDGWISFDAQFKTTGRYKVEVVAIASDSSNVWVEDYIDNPDQRTYNVTGSINMAPSSTVQTLGVEGSPFSNGLHQMKLHAKKALKVDKIIFTLMVTHQQTHLYLTQSTQGKEWNLVWSDEFEKPEIDQTKWTYDIGNWGWGNNELQYYTQNRKDNARIENGMLLIEAKKDDMGQKWTSARLTTRGKVSFLYGKIEFRAKVPKERGNWAAGWTLGDDYVDEKSWPYCGEIDILESVGYEVDSKSGDGIAHATVHTPAYYFKINNQISSTKNIKAIAEEFHTYAIEWTPTEIKAFVDGEQYYLYDKNANEKEWPFAKPQNIILNLAMGGGWGGAKGLDPQMTSQKFYIDYVRVFEKK